MTKNSAANKGRSVTAGSRKKKKRKSVLKYLHVVYDHEEGWIIHTDRSYRTQSAHATQREAVEVGRALAKKKEITLVIHRRNNWVKKWERYSREPLPPPQPPQVLYPTDPPRTATRAAIRRAVIKAIEEQRLANELKDESQPDRRRKHATTSKLKSASQR